jgi:hypothetical protein
MDFSFSGVAWTDNDADLDDSGEGGRIRHLIV